MGHRLTTVFVNAAGHDLWVSDCWQCGTVYAMPLSMMETRRKDGAAMYCPLGHAGYFGTGKTQDQRRIEELEAEVAREKANRESAQRQREWAESRAKGANIQAGKAKAAQRRLIERVHAGVCPHCNRTFKQLAAHMKSKHRKLVGRPPEIHAVSKATK